MKIKWKKNTFICPRFWCFKTNTSMTKDQIDAGECGGSTKIIPKNATTIPDDAYAYEFTNDKHKDANGNYVPYGPSCLDTKSSLCIPCCSKNKFKNKKSQK